MSDQKPIAYLLSGVRTPIGSFRGALSTLSSVELGTIVAKEALKRADASPNQIEETFVGSVLTANGGQNVARQIAIAAGLPKDSQAVTVNKVCSSSLKALQLACLSIQAGYRERCLVVGAESMSQVPFYMPRGEIPYGGLKLIDGIAKDGLEDAIVQWPMGLCAEKSVTDYGITREQSDTYAIESYKKAANAWETGLFVNEVLTVQIPQKRGEPKICAEDEEFKKLMETKVPTLSASFKKDGGTITAANASSLNDGAVAGVVTAKLPQGSVALAEILGITEAGLDPVDFTVAPVFAARKLLAQFKIEPSAIALWEVNEAFSATALAFIKELNIDPLLVNVKGGAVALGHPLGMSGLRIVVSLAHSLKSGQLGVAAICNGGGEAMAVLLRKP
ncbi:unnamed protein product, partial [Mesorhabditis belari]|uniref:Uncharacterized protein n=1 Tax=Mesorhabditis belari TaxID=2138241 RepID=A0AAF3ETU3_9BILA